MKSLVSVTACFACMAALGDTPNLATGLSGYWSFDETSGGVLHDSSGNGKNGNLVNFPGGQGNWTAGAIGGALQFGGPITHQYVSVTNIPMPTTSMTLTAWVLANSFPASATIAANWNGGWGDFNFNTSFSILKLAIADGQNGTGININQSTSTESLSGSQWHFVAFVANAAPAAGNVTFIVDGAAAGSFSYGRQLISAGPQLNIGGDTSNNSPGVGYWDGKIDDLAFWSRALTAEELSTIYNAGLSGQSLFTIIPEPSVPALLASATLALLLHGARSKREAVGKPIVR